MLPHRKHLPLVEFAISRRPYFVPTARDNTGCGTKYATRGESGPVERIVEVMLWRLTLMTSA